MRRLRALSRSLRDQSKRSILYCKRTCARTRTRTRTCTTWFNHALTFFNVILTRPMTLTAVCARRISAFSRSHPQKARLPLRLMVRDTARMFLLRSLLAFYLVSIWTLGLQLTLIPYVVLFRCEGIRAHAHSLLLCTIFPNSLDIL